MEGSGRRQINMRRIPLQLAAFCLISLYKIGTPSSQGLLLSRFGSCVTLVGQSSLKRKPQECLSLSYSMLINWTILERNPAEPSGASKPRFAGWVVCASCYYVACFSLPSLIQSRAAYCDENMVFFEMHMPWTNNEQTVERTEAWNDRKKA